MTLVDVHHGNHVNHVNHGIENNQVDFENNWWSHEHNYDASSQEKISYTTTKMDI